LSVTSADRHRLFGPAEFAMTAPALAAVLQRVRAVLPAGPVKVGVEAAGHYHRPLLGSGVWPTGWEVVVLSPARVSEQRRVQGRRRVKTDAVDLEAITELVLAGHGVVVTAGAATVIELTGWAMHRGRRILARTAVKNQLLGQLDRCFPGLTAVVPDVLGTKVGRLVAAEFTDRHRLVALGVARFVGFAANRGLRVRRSTADRLVAAARAALPAPEAKVARPVLADDQQRSDPAARRYGQQLRARGKKGGVIGCAMANRANRIAYALVRDQSGYDPDRWA
jgi:transposase